MELVGAPDPLAALAELTDAVVELMVGVADTEAEVYVEWVE